MSSFGVGAVNAGDPRWPRVPDISFEGQIFLSAHCIIPFRIPRRGVYLLKASDKFMSYSRHYQPNGFASVKTPCSKIFLQKDAKRMLVRSSSSRDGERQTLAKQSSCLRERETWVSTTVLRPPSQRRWARWHARTGDLARSTRSYYSVPQCGSRVWARI
jgi:hypothetical protein